MFMPYLRNSCVDSTNYNMILFLLVLVFSSKLLAFQGTSVNQTHGNLFETKLIPHFHLNKAGNKEMEMFRIIAEEIEETRKELQAQKEMITKKDLEINYLKKQIHYLGQRNMAVDPLPGIL